MPPLRFLVYCGVGKCAQRANGLSVNADARGGDFRSRWFVHEGHKLIRKPRHGAADADAANVRTTANTGHPTTLGYVAVHHGSPAAQLHDALRRTIDFREVALLVIAGAVAAVVYGLAKQPGRPELIVERNHRRQPRYLIEEIQH